MGAFVKVLAERPGLCVLAGNDEMNYLKQKNIFIILNEVKEMEEYKEFKKR